MIDFTSRTAADRKECKDGVQEGEEMGQEREKEKKGRRKEGQGRKKRKEGLMKCSTRCGCGCLPAS